MVNQRHNTGLDHKGNYLNMAQVIAIENRVPSAHLRYFLVTNIQIFLKKINYSDKPLTSARKVDYYPTEGDISKMTDWCLFFISKALVENFPAMKSCQKFVK